jgi:hypothetical protein
MISQKYTINTLTVQNILAFVDAGSIAIPEIQRPFVWDTSKVRDLIDSLYKGYPIGYLITWQNPDVRLKNGTASIGKKILIDGQQRVTALTAALLGREVVNDEYKKVRIRIAFHPGDERFEVFNPAIAKDVAWIPDVSAIINGQLSDLHKICEKYAHDNNSDINEIFQKITNVQQITNVQLGIIDLWHDLDIDVVTDIFIRINSQGVVLSQADFAMSKISANSDLEGTLIRKTIDYFCHLAKYPEFYSNIRENDKEFARTDNFQKISWLQNTTDDLYDPTYVDVLRVAFATEFERGKLADLVSMLSGRNFETRAFEEQIILDTFTRLHSSVLTYVKENNFKNYIMIIKSIGFIEPWMIRSKTVLNMGYMVYLKLKSKGVDHAKISHYVARWFVLSMLTQRYSSSPETQIDYDIKQIAGDNFRGFIKNLEDGLLSDAFWKFTLPTNMTTSYASSPYLHVFLAAQVKDYDGGFLCNDLKVHAMIENNGNIHHIFPKDYLQKHGAPQAKYNQIANYAYMKMECNIQVSNRSPKQYLGQAKDQVMGTGKGFGNINTMDELVENLRSHAIPMEIFDMEYTDYETFLEERRRLMAEKIRNYYFSL